MGTDGGGERNLRKGQKKKSVGSEYYDLTDPFINDSELAIDERTFADEAIRVLHLLQVVQLRENSHWNPKSKTTVLSRTPRSPLWDQAITRKCNPRDRRNVPIAPIGRGRDWWKAQDDNLNGKLEWEEEAASRTQCNVS